MSRSPGSAPCDGDRPAEHVHARKRRVKNVLGGVVVVDGTVEPLATVHAEDIARFDLDLGRDVPMPPVVANDLLLGELLRGIEGKHYFRHCIS